MQRQMPGDAISQIKSGRMLEARAMLEAHLQHNENDTASWFWYVETWPTLREKIRALELCLRHNPTSTKVQEALAKLKAHASAIEAVPPTDATAQDTGPSPAPRSSGPITAGTDSPIIARENPPQIHVSDQQLLEQYVAMRAKQGWQVITLTPTSAQLKKPKQWNTLALVVGLLSLVIGLGLLILIIAVLDYLLKKDEIIFVTSAHLRAGIEPKVRSAGTRLAFLLLFALLLLIPVVACVLLVLREDSAILNPQPLETLPSINSPPTATLRTPEISTSTPSTPAAITPTSRATTPPTFGTVTVSPTPETCSSVRVAYIPSSSYRSFDVTNYGSQAVIITTVVVSWAGEGTLEHLLFGGMPIRTLSPPATPVPIISQFDGTVGARQLDPGQTKTFELGIPGQILATTLTLVIDDGACLITTMTR